MVADSGAKAEAVTQPMAAAKTWGASMRPYSPIVPKPSGPDRLYEHPNVPYGDWRDDLMRDGFVVVKNVISAEKAAQYGDEMLSYLENFAGGLGFKRDDPSTIVEDKLPIINEKGMVIGYGVAHESFTWAMRSEPGVLDAFTKVYDTPDLIVSFDNVNMSLPNRNDLPANKPWPHQDQDPKKPGFRGMQGLLNLFPNGDNDGGLLVCKGAHNLSVKLHETFKNEANPVYRWTKEWYGFTTQGMSWLEENGCEWIKVNTEPGDLILWDSRTPHYNVSPTSNNPRFCGYICCMPAAEASQEDLIRKKGAYEKLQATTHFPNALHIGGVPTLRNGKPCPYNTNQPRQAPTLSEVGFKLTGIPYIQV